MLYDLPPPAGALPPHHQMAVCARGPAAQDAHAILLCLHGRGATAERFIQSVAERLPEGGPEGLQMRLVAPRAVEHSWYPKGFRAPLEENQPGLDSALSVTTALFDEAAAAVGADRVLVVGFSQGACVALTWLSVTDRRPGGVLALTGAHTPMPGAHFKTARGLPVHLSRAVDDPWIAAAQQDETLKALKQAGAEISLAHPAGSAHQIHPEDAAALARAAHRLRLDSTGSSPS